MSTTTSPPTPRIAIIGAGPAGLTLARILHLHALPATIYELDISPSTRDQGGIIDLHPGSGQLALQDAGLLEAFRAHALPAAEAMKLVKADGRIAWDENDVDARKIEKARGAGKGERERPEIDRGVLRGLLVESLPEGCVRWGMKLLSVTESDGAEGKYDLHFADGIVERDFDLVVGADGAWSRVRPLLTDLKPHYSGITIVELRAAKVSENHPWLGTFVGSGSLFMFDEGRAVVAQRNGNDAIRVYAAVRQAEDWVESCGIDWSDQDAARKALMEGYFGDCGDDIKRAVGDEACDGLRVWKTFMLPVGMKWEGRKGVTLLGDAAHLMTPFAGVGVNVALADAADLAKALVKRREELMTEGLKDAVEEYEALMFERANINGEKTWQGLRCHFSADGIEERVGRLRGHVKRMEQEMARREGGVREMGDEKWKAGAGGSAA